MRFKPHTLQLRHTLAVTAIMLASLQAIAYDFSANGLYFNYEYSTGGVEVTSASDSYNSYSGEVVIPSKVNNGVRDYYVTAVGDNAFRNCDWLTAVVMSERIARIGKQAFYNCSHLSKVDIPAGVNFIDSYAFAQCNSLVEVSFNNNEPVEVGAGAFMNCAALSSVKWPSSEALDGRGGITILGTNAFARCSALTSIYLPGEIQLLGTTIFDGCSGLSSITVTRETPLTVNGDPFALNGSQVTINVPSTGIAGETSSRYSNAIGWKKYNINELPYSFIDAKRYTYLKLGNGAVALTGRESTSDNHVVVRSEIVDFNGNTHGVTEIAPGAFKASSVKTLDTSSAMRLKSLGSQCFAQCSALYSVTLIEGITIIDDQAFSLCTALPSIQVPSTVRTIAMGAFEGCKRLANVQLFTGLTTIGEKAFAQCTSLTSIDLPRSLSNVEAQAFSGTTSLEAINVEPQCQQYASCDGVLYERKFGEDFEGNMVGKMNKLIHYPSCKTSEEYCIPCGVTAIDSYAMQGAAHLKCLSIPESTTSFGTQCFAGTTIETINYRSTNPSNNGTTGLTSSFKSNAKLLVPVGTTAQYLALAAWNGFKSIAECDHVYQDQQFAYDWNSSSEATIVGVNAAAVDNNGVLTIPGTVTMSGYQALVTTLSNSCMQGVAQTVKKLIIAGDSLQVIDTSDDINPLAALNAIKQIEVVSTNPYFKVSDGILLSKQGNKLYFHTKATSQQHITLPSNIEVIMPQAFAGRQLLTRITLNTGLKQVGAQAFAHCTSLQSVDNARSVTTLGNRAFAECSSLKSFNGGERLSEIGDEAFINCKNLTSFPFTHGMLNSIGSRAFKGCTSITKVVLGANLSEISDQAFEGCTSLSKVFFTTEFESMGSQVFKGCSSLSELWLCNEEAPDVDSELLPQSSLGTAQLFVPQGSASSYQSKAPWNKASCINSSSYLFNAADVNNDKAINALDITLTMSVLLGELDGDVVGHFDVNQDGAVTSTDVTVIYNYILTGTNMQLPYRFVRDSNSPIATSIGLNDSHLIIRAIDQSVNQHVTAGLLGDIDNTTAVSLAQGSSQGAAHLEITPLAPGYFSLVAIVSDGTTCYWRAFPIVVTE